MAPRNINYDNTYFYKICCKDINIKEIYIGQTTDFTRRKYSHGHACYNDKRPDYNMRVYKFIRDNGGWDNWDMILIENCKCENRLYVLRKEREYIEQFEATLNKQIPSHTPKEYKLMNKETLKEKATTRKIAKKNKIHELLKTHIQDLNIIEEILALV